ncbi:hypothetical protein AESSP_00899 [Aestuariimicrobium sp. T2.26MG-19.2B]|nr:hypothetical protein AESSP_00899 [Aestuariimicrobium sp. T2.26MG-19.2B]
MSKPDEAGRGSGECAPPGRATRRETAITTRIDEAITRIHRAEWARVVASLTRRVGSLDIAEEATAEAFATAVEHWRREGLPPQPGGWLTTTATRKAIDRIRRDQLGRRKLEEVTMGESLINPSLSGDPFADPLASADDDPGTALPDDRLRLIFTCAHPALSMEARVALTLRMVGGLTVPEIASAFLVRDTTMGQRISRAKRKIAEAGIPYRVPTAEDLPVRLEGVLAALFLIFNEGYLASSPDSSPVRVDLCQEATRLARLLHVLLPDEGEVTGLLALMLLIGSRHRARVSSSGELVTLDEQDRGCWDRAAITEGQALVRQRIATGVPPGRYQLLAAINAVHTSAAEARDTDWEQIVTLYDQLRRVDPSPIVALNRAVAVAELDGPRVALAEILPLEEALSGYHPFHVVRAELLRRIGDGRGARTSYSRALELATNSAERAHLSRRLGELGRD